MDHEPEEVQLFQIFRVMLGSLVAALETNEEDLDVADMRAFANAVSRSTRQTRSALSPDPVGPRRRSRASPAPTPRPSPWSSRI
jgi:hypothetical protein